MSIKINDAFRTNMPLTELMARLIKTREVLTEEAKRLASESLMKKYLKGLIKNATKTAAVQEYLLVIDKLYNRRRITAQDYAKVRLTAKLLCDTLDKVDRLLSLETLRTEAKKLTKKKTPKITVGLYPLDNEIFLGKIFGGEREFYGSIYLTLNATDYSYDNRDDSLPIGISMESMTQRKKDWDQVIGNKKYIECGLFYEVVPELDLNQDILGFMLNPDEKAKLLDTINYALSYLSGWLHNTICKDMIFNGSVASITEIIHLTEALRQKESDAFKVLSIFSEELQKINLSFIVID